MAGKINYSPATLERRRAYCRAWRKENNHTVDGKAKKREQNRRWKKSDNGKKYNREWANKQYIPSQRVKLTPQERKERERESFKRSLQKPHIRAKRRQTAWRLHLKKTYGVSAEQFIKMAEEGCHICGHPDSPEKHLHVDHDHATGRVRGLLCDPCNRGLGCFRDDVDKIRQALLYLRGA